MIIPYTNRYSVFFVNISNAENVENNLQSSQALRTVLVVNAVPKYVTLNKALDFKITTLL